MLLSAVGRPRATYDGQDLYQDLFHKAGALMDSFIRNYPFLDGNRRTGITAAGVFLRINGYHLNTSEGELFTFTIAVAESRHTLDEIVAWLRAHVSPI